MDIQVENNNLILDKPCVILPHYGEFGWFIFRYMKIVYSIKSPHKIVCCNKGEEILFPNSDNFFYEWENPLPYSERNGFRDYNNDSKYILIEKLKKTFPDHEIVDLSSWKIIENVFCYIKQVEHLHMFYHWQDIEFDIKVQEKKLPVDIVLGARSRSKNIKRNWPHWDEFSGILRKNNITFAVVGEPNNTYKVPNANYYSWDFQNNIEMIIYFLKKSLFFVGNDTGTAHIANFLRKDIFVINKQYKDVISKFFKPIENVYLYPILNKKKRKRIEKYNFLVDKIKRQKTEKRYKCLINKIIEKKEKT